MSFKKQILQEEQKEIRAKKIAMIVFWILLPFIAYVGVQVWTGMLGF